MRVDVSRDRAGPSGAEHRCGDGFFEGEAVADLYDAFRRALVRRVRSRLPEPVAEDVAQEVFIQALHDIRRYDSERASPRTWLSQLGDQALAKHLRRRHRRLRAEGEFARAGGGQAPGLDPGEREDVRRLLKQLTPLNHWIVATRYLLGASIEEIAQETGLSVKAVEKRVERSLAKLRQAALDAEAGADSGLGDEFLPECRKIASNG